MKDLLFRYTLIIHHKFPYIGRLITFCYHNLLYIYNNVKTSKTEYSKNLIEGKNLLEKYTKDDKYYYVLINAGIGDSFIVASYAYYLKKKYKKDIAFIVLNSHVQIVSGYDYIKKVIGCSKEEYDKIFLYIANEDKYETSKYKYAFFKMKASKNGIRNWATTKMENNMTLSEKYRKYVFNLDNKAKMYKLKIDNDKKEIKKILEENKIKENSVLLIPYAYSTTNLGIEVWEKLTNVLKEKGYNVYTNIGNPKKEHVIKGSDSINLPMDVMLKICGGFSYIISNRCGFGEYLSHNNPKMILIDEWKKYPCGWDDVNMYSSKKTIKYVYRDRKNNDELVNDILDMMGVVK